MGVAPMRIKFMSLESEVKKVKCSVNNCGIIIKEEESVKIGEDFYCMNCATIYFKQLIKNYY